MSNNTNVNKVSSNNVNNQSMNSNNSNSNNNNNDNDMSNLVIIILMIAGIVLLAFIIIMIIIYVKTRKQNKIKSVIEEQLLNYIHDCKDNPIDIAGSKIPASTLGNEYSLNYWLYINSLEYRANHNKQVLMKGDPGSFNKELQVYTNSNPAIYIEKNTNTMKLLFEKSSGESEYNDLGCYRLFDIKPDIPYHIKLGENDNNLSLSKKDDDDTLEYSNIPDKYISVMLVRLDDNNYNIKVSSGGTEGEEQYLQYDQERILSIMTKGEDDELDDFSKFTINEVQGKYNLFKIVGINMTPPNPEETTTVATVDATGVDATSSGSNEQFTGGNEIENINANNVRTDTSEAIDLNTDLLHIVPVDYNSFKTDGEDTVLSTVEECRELSSKSENNNEKFGMSSFDRIIGEDENLSEIDNSYCYLNQFDNKVITDSKKVNNEFCKLDKDVNETLGSKSHMYIHSTKAGSSHQVFEIKNIPLQRWVCMNVSVRDHVVDIYMDGLLYKTFILEGGSPKPNNFPIILGNNGGFDGYLSNITWSNKALHPGAVYEKYKEGPRIMKTVWDRLKGMFGGNKDTQEGNPREDEEKDN